MAEKSTKKKESEQQPRSTKSPLIRILQLLYKYSDYDHPMTQEEIADRLYDDYAITIERKAVSRNLSTLREAGYDIRHRRSKSDKLVDDGAKLIGFYIESREFDDSELRLLIDGVLSSKHINARDSKDLIDKLCDLSSVYFRSHVKHIFTVNDWGKTENKGLFYNIDLVDIAIEEKKQLKFDFVKYGADKKLHRTSTQYVSPYQMILHNQRYYLMCYNEIYKNINFYRLDHITNMTMTDKKATPLRSLEGYKNGIDYKQLSSSMPYLYSGDIKPVEFKADACIVDDIVEWFGRDAIITDNGDGTVKVSVRVSLGAMEHWAMQYINYVEIITPTELREAIKKSIKDAGKKYR